MSKAPRLLPFKVFQLIESYLQDDKRAECIKVCWNWTVNQGYNTMDDTGRHVKSIQFLPSATFSVSEQAYAPSLTDVELTFRAPNLPCLTRLRRLQHINFTWPDGKLCLKQLKEIHQHCSLLETLDITALQFNTASIVLGLQTNIASKLTRFTLKSQHYISSIEPIFIYAARKYPQLEYLCIQSVTPTSSKTDSEEKEEEPDIGTLLLKRYSAYIPFVRECPHVSTLALGNIVPDQALLEAISAMGIQLRQLSIESVFDLSRSTYDLMIRTAKHAVTSITLRSLLCVCNATQTLMSTLVSCQKLAHLDLGKQSDIPVDLVLDHCPQLISPSLYDTMAILDTVENGDTWVHPSQHVKLHQFSLNKIMFDNSVFDYLTRRCPKLTQLTIINSICSSSNTFVRIHMPSSRLGQVKTDRLFAGRYSRKSGEQITRVALSIIQQKPTELQYERPEFDADITRWYETGKWGIDPYGCLSICCQYIDRLFVNEIKLI